MKLNTGHGAKILHADNCSYKWTMLKRTHVENIYIL